MIYSTWERDPAFQGTWLGFCFSPSLASLRWFWLVDIFVTARPKYRKNMSSNLTRKMLDDNDLKNRRQGSYGSKLVSENSRTLKWAVQQYKPVQVKYTNIWMYKHSIVHMNLSLHGVWFQVWDWLFKSCQVNGRILTQNGMIDLKDIEECILKGNCKKLGIEVPAWSILQCLLASAKSNSLGLVICMYLNWTYILILDLFFLQSWLFFFEFKSWWCGVDKNEWTKR